MMKAGVEPVTGSSSLRTRSLCFICFRAIGIIVSEITYFLFIVKFICISVKDCKLIALNYKCGARDGSGWGKSARTKYAAEHANDPARIPIDAVNLY